MVMLMFYPPFAQQFTTHFLDISSHSSSFNTPFVWFFFSQRVPFQVLIYLYISSRFMRDYDAQFYRILISYTRQGKASQDITGDVKMGRFEFLNQSGQTNSEEILIWKKRSRIENDRKLIKVTRSDENRAHFHTKYFDDFPMPKWEWFDWENVSFLFCFKSNAKWFSS